MTPKVWYCEEHASNGAPPPEDPNVLTKMCYRALWLLTAGVASPPETGGVDELSVCRMGWRLLINRDNLRRLIEHGLQTWPEMSMREFAERVVEEVE